MSLDEVPDDFPRSTLPHMAMRDELLNVDAAGSWRVYIAGVEPEERHHRWLYCEALAKNLLLFARHEAAKHPGQSPDDTLGCVWVAIARKGWVSLAELDWLVLRMKALLQW
ncbi:hypothetical protein ACQCQP_10820 [Ralstonia pseudosolanacearum]|uniref:hypothetical protein n=1 Tax=Ralstonia pseudosolanacearum TaxID=1310165 RepID=UPI003CEB66FD